MVVATFSKSDSAKFWLSRKIYRKKLGKKFALFGFCLGKGGRQLHREHRWYIRTFFSAHSPLPYGKRVLKITQQGSSLKLQILFFSFLVYFTIHYIARHTHFPCTQHSKKPLFRAIRNTTTHFFFYTAHGVGFVVTKGWWHYKFLN